MSALLTPRRPAPGEQESLFAAASAPPRAPKAPAERAPRETPVSEPAAAVSAPRQGPTLDDLVAGAWEGLLAGAPASCVVCGTTMHPRYSGGHAPVGGRCTGCGTTLG